MDNLSENFQRSEFKCKCNNCNFNTVDVELIRLLETVRARFGKPVTITSAARCASHNKAVGGSDTSQHLLGKAADIVVKDTPPSEVFEFVTAHMPNKGGFGAYNDFTHVDVRDEKSRWVG